MPVGHFLVPYEYLNQPGDKFWRRLPIADQKHFDWAEAEIEGDQAIVRARAPKAELDNLGTTYKAIRRPEALWTPHRRIAVDAHVSGSVEVLPNRTLDDLAADVPTDRDHGALKRRAEQLAAKADREGYAKIEDTEWSEAARLLVILGAAGYTLDKVSTGTFPVNGLLDDFTRADSTTTLGSNWSPNLVTPGWPSHGISSNTGYAPSNFKSNWWNVTQFTQDEEVYCTVSTLQSAGVTGLCCRIANPNTASINMYEYRWGNTDSFLLRWDNNGGSTQLGANLFTFPATGNRTGSDIVGSTYTAYTDTGGGFASIGTRTDSTYNTFGYLGWDTNDATTFRMDNFSGGQLASPVGGIVPIPLQIGMGMGFGR